MALVGQDYVIAKLTDLLMSVLALQERERQICGYTHLPVDLFNAWPAHIIFEGKGLHQHLKNGTRLRFLVPGKCLDPAGFE